MWRGAHITPPSASGEYNGLKYGPEGYTFRDSTTVNVSGADLPLPVALASVRDGELDARDVIESVLGAGLAYPPGFLEAAEDMLLRMHSGNTCLDVIGSLGSREEFSPSGTLSPYTPRTSARSRLLDRPIGSLRELSRVVDREVRTTPVVDVHTHLLPASHGKLWSSGIDDLLTYHYLVSEYLQVGGRCGPREFFALGKKEQAERIWRALFVDRPPVSEAARGVVSVLNLMGMGNLFKARDLEGIRGRMGARSREEAEEEAFRASGVRYAVMTNVVFNPAEVAHLRPKKGRDTRYRTALRVDPLLAGDWASLKVKLAEDGLDATLAGAKAWLRKWVDDLEPEYFMASTPASWDAPVRKPDFGGVGAFASGAKGAGEGEDCCGEDDDEGTLIDVNSDLLNSVLLPVAQELGLPVALKIGCVRQVNPALQMAGDGVQVATCESLQALLQAWPGVRFLATFLSREDQHAACVLTNKFPNLHLYGCWWYCNIPSLIAPITSMRLQMLGQDFTYQHSDCRVLEQLVYKWAHSRRVLVDVLREELGKVWEGAGLTRAQVRGVVARISGGAYEEFLAEGAPPKPDDNGSKRGLRGAEGRRAEEARRGGFGDKGDKTF